MRTLLFNGNTFEAEKIIKTETDIVGYDLRGNEVFAFRGISDFSMFQLEVGQEFDVSDSEVNARAMAQLTLENADLKQQMQTLSQTVAQMQIGGVK